MRFDHDYIYLPASALRHEPKKTEASFSHRNESLATFCRLTFVQTCLYDQMPLYKFPRTLCLTV